jgi:hypothetical protein
MKGQNYCIKMGDNEISKFRKSMWATFESVCLCVCVCVCACVRAHLLLDTVARSQCASRPTIARSLH